MYMHVDFYFLCILSVLHTCTCALVINVQYLNNLILHVVSQSWPSASFVMLPYCIIRALFLIPTLCDCILCSLFTVVSIETVLWTQVSSVGCKNLHVCGCLYNIIMTV